jgi:predicted dehydrogenase
MSVPARNKVRLGIVGAGNIAVRHLETLQAVEDAVVAGLVSRTASKAQALASRFAIPCVANDMESLIRDARPDALLLLVSAASTYEVARFALETGLPLFIEKPAGLVPAESAALARLARECGARTMVGYNRRYYSVFHRGIEIVRNHGPLLGVMIEGHERMDAVRAGGRHSDDVLAAWLYANSTHTIDLLRFFGGEAVTLHSLARRVREPRGDQFAAIMEFESGALGEYSAHWLSPGGWRAVLYGRGVTAEFKPLESGRWTDATGNVHELTPSIEDQRFKPGFYGQMQAFCKLVRGAPAAWPLQDLEGAHRTMLLAENIAKPATISPERAA